MTSALLPTSSSRGIEGYICFKMYLFIVLFKSMWSVRGFFFLFKEINTFIQ